MKRSLFVVFCLATMVYAGAAYAYESVKDCIATACNLQNTYTVVGQDATGCSRYTSSCYSCNGNWKIYDCKDCDSSYTHSTETLYVSQKTSVTVGQCTKSTGIGICSTTNYYGSDYPQIKGCTSIKAQKFGGEIVSTCEECETGYSTFSHEISVDGCSNKYTQTTCAKDLVIEDCNSDNCKSDEYWLLAGLAGSNYVQKTNRSCRFGRCKEVVVYSCKSGYYGTATATSQECHECPDGGTSEPGDNTVITKCYSTGGKDAMGDYKFEPDCYYTGQ